MDHIKFEELLGKHLSAVEETLGSKFRKSNNEQVKVHLHFSQHFNMDFYGMYSHILSVETDKNDVVEAITIHFNKVINRPFYNMFVEKYGEPIHTYVMSNIKIVSEGVYNSDDGFSSNVSKSEGDLVEGTFDDKPLAMIWEEDGFYIQAFLRHESNISEIMFSVESPPFNVKPSKKN